MTLGEEERCYWAGVSLTEVCSPVPIQLMLGTHSLVRYKKSKSAIYVDSFHIVPP